MDELCGCGSPDLCNQLTANPSQTLSFPSIFTCRSTATVLRAAINRGEVMFIDQHLSETVEQLRSGQISPIDYAVVEAVAITEDGGIVPSTSVGNSASFAILAKKVIGFLGSADGFPCGPHGARR